jgi:carbonic anhydrase/acetyltransferase-like protein (isoleucine patch superfamily)
VPIVAHSAPVVRRRRAIIQAMLLRHRDHEPSVDPTAYIAPNATLCGDVRVGPGARILFGAVVSAEDGRVEIGARSIVMENAVLRGVVSSAGEVNPAQ